MKNRERREESEKKIREGTGRNKRTSEEKEKRKKGRKKYYKKKMDFLIF